MATTNSVLLSPKNDPLWLLKRIFVDFMFHSFLKKFNLFVIFFNSVLFLFQINYVLQSANKKNILSNYGPTMCIVFFMLFEMWTSITYEKRIKEYVIKLHQLSWSLQDNENIILEKLRPLFIFTVVVVVNYLLAVFFVSPVFRYQQDIFLIKELFGEFCPQCGTITEIIFWITAPSLVYSGMVNIGVMFYLIVNFKVQMSLLICYVDNMSKDVDQVDDHLWHTSRTYQQKISSSLQFIVERHSTLIIYLKKIIASFTSTIQLHLVIFFLINIATIFFVINLFSDNDWRINLRSFHVTLTCFLATYFLATICQLIPDMTTEFFDITTKLPWYRWNSVNRKMLLILRINSIQPVSINLPQLGSVGYSCIFKFGQTIYSTTTVLYSLRE